MDIIRAWKDADYRNSLSAAERAALPVNPAGDMGLTEEDLSIVVGGAMLRRPFPTISAECCTLADEGCPRP